MIFCLLVAKRKNIVFFAFSACFQISLNISTTIFTAMEVSGVGGAFVERFLVTEVDGTEIFDLAHFFRETIVAVGLVQKIMGCIHVVHVISLGNARPISFDGSPLKGIHFICRYRCVSCCVG